MVSLIVSSAFPAPSTGQTTVCDALSDIPLLSPTLKKLETQGFIELY